MEGAVAEAWLQSLQRCFGLRPYGSNLKARLAVHQLRGDASNWWHQEEIIGGVRMDTLTWELLLERFKERYLSEHFRPKQIKEFHCLYQRGLTVAQYESRFLEILPYLEYMKEEKQQVHHFIMGLNLSL